MKVAVTGKVDYGVARGSPDRAEVSASGEFGRTRRNGLEEPAVVRDKVGYLRMSLTESSRRAWRQVHNTLAPQNIDGFAGERC